MLTQSMRPKCKEDTYSIPTSDGIYLRRNNSRLILKGKSLYSLLEHLTPHLNGSVTLEELTAGLDADRKRMITHLIEKLFAHDFVKDTSRDQRHTLRPLELETYATNIAFIESFQISAPHRFEAFRDRHLLIVRSGPGFASLIQTGLQCGVKQISALAVPDHEESAGHFDDFVRYDAEQTVSLLTAPCWETEEEVRGIIQEHDAVLHIAGPATLARARMLNRLCREERKTLIQAVVLDNQAWIGPLVDPEGENCWECAWLRLRANQGETPEAFSREQLRASHDRSLSAAEATLIANQMLFTLFQFFTQTGSGETAGKICVLDLDTFQSESHRFLPHPACQVCLPPAAASAAQFFEQIQQLRQQTSPDAETFLQEIAGCVDERCGLFTALDATPFVQVPLAVYQVRLANPFPAKDRPASLDVIATSIDTEEARMRVLRKACERYAAHCLPPQRLFSLQEARRLSSSTLAPDQLIGVGPSASEDLAWTWALDLQTQQAALVPATGMLSERGVASGENWDEALCRALLDWCNYLTIEQLMDAERPYLQVDLEKTPLTSAGAYIYRLLKATGRQIAAYDVTGSLQVPTFAISLDEKVVTYSTHCEAEQALRMGLEQALQQYQSEHFQQADYALAPVPDCPAHLRSEQLCLPRYRLPDTWSARKAWLLRQLQSVGLRSFVVPLNADPALARALPLIVRVFLSQKQAEEGRAFHE